MTNNSTLCNTVIMEQIFMWFTAFCAPLTIIFNALVLYIAYKFIDLRMKLNQIFVVSMTVADLVYGLNYMATRPFVDYIPYWLCRPYYVITWVCQIASVMFLLFLNVDKFISLTFPLHYHSMVTERIVMIQVGFCWSAIVIYAVISAFEPLFSFKKSDCSECANAKVNPHYYLVMIFVFYICPTVISVIISVYIFVLAQHKTRWMPDFPDSKVDHRREKRKLFKRVFFVFSSTAWTAFTSLPYRFGFSAYLICAQLSQKDIVISSPCNHTAVSSLSENISSYSNEIDYNTVNSTYDDLITITSNLTSDQTSSNPCMNASISLLIWSFMIILQFGSVGNPLITIITQRAYRQRAFFIWSIFLKRIHCPRICIPTSYIPVRRKSKSEDESTKVVELMSDEPLMIPTKRVSKPSVFELM